jgi:hypothetical protein
VTWAEALRGLEIRHPDPAVTVRLILEHGLLALRVENVIDNDTGKRRDLGVSTVSLAHFPGITEARRWIACAWAGYLMHEALEGVTVDGVRVLDPHTEPYETNPWNRPVRDALPVTLTPEALIAAMRVVTGV